LITETRRIPFQLAFDSDTHGTSDCKYKPLYLRHAILGLLDVLERRPVCDEVSQGQTMCRLVLLHNSALSKDLHVRVAVRPLLHWRRKYVRWTRWSIAWQLAANSTDRIVLLKQAVFTPSHVKRKHTYWT